MNKLFTKIAALALGAAMAVGVGVAVSSKNVGAAHGATTEVASIAFNTGSVTSGNTSSQISISTNISTLGTQTPAGYFGTKVSAASNSYYASAGGQGGIRVGKSSGAGSITFALATAITNAVRVDIVSYQCSSGKTLSVANSTTSTVTPAASSTTYSFNMPSSLSSITINTSGQLWVTSIKLYADEEGGGGSGFEINTTNFTKPGSGSGYTPYNGTREIDGISIYSYQVMVQSNKLQFQSNNGWLKNSTSFGKITKITLATSTNLTIYLSATEFGSSKPTTGTTTTSGTAITSGTYGYFAIVGGGNTPKTATITVDSEAATYTVSFGVNTAGYGTVSQASITGVASGTSITSSSNTVTVGSTTVTATPAASTAQYTYAFSGWTGASGTVTADKTITANFTRTTNKYTVYWKNWDNSTLETDTNVDYGTTPTYNSATPTKAATAEYTYTFTGWSPAVAAITGNTTYTAQFSQTKNTFTVTDNVTDGSVYDLGSDSVLSPIEYGEDLMVNIVPDSGCDYPEEVTVTMGGNDITEDIIYDPTDGSIMYEGVTGNISITAECPISGSMHSIDVNCTNCTYSGPDEMGDEQEVQITITPSSGYKLPSAAVVGVNTYISVSNAVEWNYSAGVITILGADEAGDVVVDVTCPALESYSITVNSGSATYSGPSTIQENGEAVIVFTHSQGCAHPADVTVSNNVTKSWNQANGTLTLSNPSGAVEVTYVEVTNQLSTITLSPSSGTYTLGQTFTVKPTVTANYTIAASADVTASATESIPEGKMDGNMFVKTGEFNITYSYTEGGVTKTADYHVTVNAFEPVPATTSWTRITSANDLTSGTYIIGYEAEAGSGTVVPLRSADCNATTSANGYFHTGTTADSSTSGSITMSTIGDNGSDYEVTLTRISSGVINIQNSDGNYYGATSGGNTSNKARLYTSGNSNETNLTAEYDSGEGLWSLTAGVSGSYKYMTYNTGSPRYAFYNSSKTQTAFYKKTQSGGTPASIIRITASYTGAQKFVGETVSESDFTVYKQMNNSDELISVTSGYTLSSTALTSTSTNITVSYEGKSFVVAVPATERTAELQSITLVQGQGVVKNYIDWSGAAWNYAGLSVAYDWDDDTYDEEISLSDLIESGADVTISPAKPSVGTTSFSVSYTYEGKSLQSNTVSGITVVEDYVTSISWTGTSAAQFKAFSGGQLTAAQVGAWHVTPTFAGSGQGNELSFADYTLKVGSKVISSLPYTWASEDDGQPLSITYGKDVDGDDFVKTNATAVGNICATINAIDHTESETIEHDVYGYRLASSVPTLSLNESVNVIIAANVGGTYHAMGEISSNKGQPYTPTVSSSVISEDDAEHVWTLTKTENGYKISNSDGYLTLSGSNTNVSITSGGSEVTITSGVKGTFRIEASRPLAYRASTFNVFGAYASSNITAAGTEYYDCELFVAEVVGHESETVETTVHYANDMDHFDAQKKVVEFAKFMNTTMNGSNVCSGTFANLESAWDDVADKYDELFGASTTLNETELAWAKNMLKYANAIWGSDAEAACVEKAMKTYEHCVAKYELDPFMSELRSVSKTSIINPVIDVNNNAPVLVTVIVSMIGLSAVGGYFFLRKRKENI